jgi:hypothetical protein
MYLLPLYVLIKKMKKIMSKMPIHLLAQVKPPRRRTRKKRRRKKTGRQCIRGSSWRNMRHAGKLTHWRESVRSHSLSIL